jgi:hypothetical protein
MSETIASDGAPDRGWERRRSWASVALVLLTIVAMVAATVAVWARQTAFDTDRFMTIVEPSLTDPAFYDGLSDVVAEQVLLALALDERVTATLTRVDSYLADALVGALDPDPDTLARLSRLERPSLASLAPPITSALETRTVAIVDRFITSEQFTERFPGLVRELHRGGVALIRDELTELPNVYLEGGDVRLDLTPVIAQVLRQVTAEYADLLPEVSVPEVLDDRRDARREQLAGALAVRLPEDFGQLTIMSGEALADVQRVATRIDRLVWALVALAIVLIAVTLASSPRRSRTLAQLAGGLLAGLALAMALVRWLESLLTARIANPDGSRAAQVLIGELFASLRNVTLLIAVAAIGAGITAYLATRSGRTSGDHDGVTVPAGEPSSR